MRNDLGVALFILLSTFGLYSFYTNTYRPSHHHYHHFNQIDMQEWLNTSEEQESNDDQPQSSPLRESQPQKYALEKRTHIRNSHNINPVVDRNWAFSEKLEKRNKMEDRIGNRLKNHKIAVSKKHPLQGTFGDPCFIAPKITPREIVGNCADLPIPLRQSRNGTSKWNKVRFECWPRIAFLVSYPTSGNGLTRDLFTAVTGLLTGVMEEHPKKPILYDFGTTKDTIRIPGQYEDKLCSSKSQSQSEPKPKPKLDIPIEGRVSLTKTHFPSFPFQRKPHSVSQFESRNSLAFLTHVVRLARNPGDHMIRNHLRWGRKPEELDCELIVERTERWVHFHSYWSNQSKQNNESFDETTTTTPQIILHYENLSNKTTAPTTMRDLLTFLNETESKADRRILEEKVRTIIREPSYEYGTLLVHSCGVDVARNVHEQTKHITKELGYHFDHERGTWSLEVGTTSIVLQ